MGGGYYPTTAIEGFAASAALISFIKIFGGYIVTKRIWDMFKRPTDPLAYTHLMGIPAAAVLASYGAVATTPHTLRFIKCVILLLDYCAVLELWEDSLLSLLLDGETLW